MKSHDLALRIEKALSKLEKHDEPDILTILEWQSVGIYCKNFVTSELEGLLLSMLGKCKKFDLRCREQKPLMAKARRRLVVGTHEVCKQIELGKVACIIVATDIDDGALLDKDLRECIEHCQNVIYCCNRKQLAGLLLVPSAKVSLIGIRHFDGAEEDWKQIQVLVERLRREWLQAMVASKGYINAFGQSLTWLVAFYGLDGVIEKIGDVLCHVNRVNPSDGTNPLIVSVQRSHEKVVKILLSSKADQLVPDFSLNLPLHYASTAYMAELLEYHERKNAVGMCPLESSVINGRIEVVKVFLKKAPDVSYSKLLFLACQSPNPKMLEFLSSKAENCLGSLIDERGNNLLMRTVDVNNYENFKFIGKLIGWVRIDWMQTNCDGDDIFQLALKRGNIGIQRKLDKIKIAI